MKNIRHLLVTSGKNQVELEALTGVAQTTIGRILSGKTKRANYRTADRIATAFGLDLDTLALVGLPQAGPRGVAEYPDPAPEDMDPEVLTAGESIPVVAAIDRDAAGFLIKSPVRERVISARLRYAPEDQDAYALRIDSDAFRQRARAGEFVVVEPNAPTPIGCDALVSVRGGRELLGEIVMDHPSGLALIPSGDSKPVYLAPGEVTSTGRATFVAHYLFVHLTKRQDKESQP